MVLCARQRTMSVPPLSVAPLWSLFGGDSVVARVAGLRLKPHKCALVPLWDPFTPALEFEMRMWLVEVIPDWGRFNVVSAATYLGLLGTPLLLSGPVAPPASVPPAPLRALLPSCTRPPRSRSLGMLPRSIAPLLVWRTTSVAPYVARSPSQATLYDVAGTSTSPPLEAGGSGVCSRTSLLAA